MTEEVEFYVQVTRTKNEGPGRHAHPFNYWVDHFTKNRPSNPGGHVVQVTLTIDPSIFESEVQAQIGLGMEGLRAVVKELHEI